MNLEFKDILALAGPIIAVLLSYVGVRVAITKGDTAREALAQLVSDFRNDSKDEFRGLRDETKILTDKRDQELWEMRKRTHEIAGNMQNAFIELTRISGVLVAITDRVAYLERRRAEEPK